MMERSLYSDWFSANIYPLAVSYAAKNPLDGYERDDYVQELVAKAWEKVDTFDPAKSNLTTFAYVWFRNVRWRLMDKMINRAKFISYADVEDSDGFVRNACDDAVSADDVAESYSEAEEMAMLSPLADAFFRGDSAKAIAKAFGMTPDEVSRTVAREVEMLRDALEA